MTVVFTTTSMGAAGKRHTDLWRKRDVRDMTKIGPRKGGRK